MSLSFLTAYGFFPPLAARAHTAAMAAAVGVFYNHTGDLECFDPFAGTDPDRCGGRRRNPDRFLGRVRARPLLWPMFVVMLLSFLDIPLSIRTCMCACTVTRPPATTTPIGGTTSGALRCSCRSPRTAVRRGKRKWGGTMGLVGCEATMETLDACWAPLPLPRCYSTVPGYAFTS